MKRSKRYLQALDKVDRNKVYSLGEALDLVCANQVKFDQSIEVQANLDIDPKQADQMVRASVVLPHGTGKTKKIAVFTTGEVDKIKAAGAAIVGGEDLIAEIKKTGRCDFQVAIAEPKIMAKLAQIARILGPKGLMPAPKNGTVTSDIIGAINDLNQGKVVFKNDTTGNVHQSIGKQSFGVEKLTENIKVFLDSLEASRQAGVKGVFIKNLSLSSSMGPGVKFDHNL